MDRAALDGLVRLRQNPDFKNLYEVELANVPALRAFDSVQVHLVLYPFSRQITADAYHFNPFEEYAEDISTRRRSLYSRVPRPANNLFGIFLGIFIIGLFLVVKPSKVASLQSIVAILGAYFIGKDLWDDIKRCSSIFRKIGACGTRPGIMRIRLKKIRRLPFIPRWRENNVTVRRRCCPNE